MTARIASMLLATVLLLGCSDFRFSPISPTRLGEGSQNVPNWSPYINIQPTGEARAAYKEAIGALQDEGAIKGARVEFVRSHGFRNDTVEMVSSMGIEVLGIVDNYYLTYDAPVIERVIDDIVRAYPEIRYLQIGNEITTIIPKHDPQISIEEYMAIFKRIYDYVEYNHPKIMLLTQSTLGSGDYGANELEKMAKLGLKDMSPDRVIVAMNVYSANAANKYAGVINGPLRKFRVWITESGIKDPSKHISYVEFEYLRLKNLLRAERIYWYVMWGSDSGVDTDFSLIKGIEGPERPATWQSPLFKKLIEQRRAQ